MSIHLCSEVDTPVQRGATQKRSTEIFIASEWGSDLSVGTRFASAVHKTRPSNLVGDLTRAVIIPPRRYRAPIGVRVADLNLVHWKSFIRPIGVVGVRRSAAVPDLDREFFQPRHVQDDAQLRPELTTPAFFRLRVTTYRPSGARARRPLSPISVPILVSASCYADHSPFLASLPPHPPSRPLPPPDSSPLLRNLLIGDASRRLRKANFYYEIRSIGGGARPVPVPTEDDGAR